MEPMDRLMVDIGNGLLIAVWLGLIMVAMAQWRRHPPAALAVVISLVLLMGAHLTNLYLQKRLMGGVTRDPQLAYQLLYILVRLVQILTYLALVWAVFTGRPRR